MNERNPKTEGENGSESDINVDVEVNASGATSGLLSISRDDLNGNSFPADRNEKSNNDKSMGFLDEAADDVKANAARGDAKLGKGTEDWDGKGNGCIEPFPEPQDPQFKLPGAHAVGGRPRFARDTPQVNGAEDSDDDEPLIDEAVVVEDSEDPEEGKDSPGIHGMSSTNTELVEVVKVLPETRRQLPPSRLPIMLLIVLMILAVALTVSFVVIFPSQDESAHSQASQQAEEESHVHHLAVVPFQYDINPTYIEAIQDIGSPANLANKWIMADPHLHSYSPARQRQRFTLAALYYTTKGNNWHNSRHWLSYEISECYWYSTSLINFGMQVCDDDDNIISVSLSSNNLNGTFPLYFSHLPKLRVFDIADNHIHGVLPALYTSSYLEVFSVSNNDLEGQLIGQGGFAAYDLRVAKVDGNRFSGSLIVFQWLKQLEFVDVTDNLFGGPIPPELQECRNLTYLGLADNLYEGPLPSELGLLSKLEEVDVSGNHLVTGVVPADLAAIETLVKLDVSETSIAGAIPAELCDRALEIVANCSSVLCCE